jgi:eukaryotic-like serine/threonine-protein kinase
MNHRVPRRLGKYEVQEPLGQGGMAEVWKAFDTRLRRAVAIKVMHANLTADPDFVSRFTREAQMVAALRHPNIVQIYDFHIGDQAQGGDAGAAAEPADPADTIAYMVMEYIQGQTLAQYLQSQAQSDPHARDLATPATIIRLFTPICLALDYAHQQGVIHRDIKPANILLDQRNTTRNPMGEPILSDFGLAKLMAGTTATVTGAVIGTPLYMSPEQIQDKPLTARSDLYSLAAVLYQVCAGAPPFTGESLTGIMLRHVNEPPPPPNTLNPALPSAVSDVLVKALAKDPLERYPSASALLVALAEAFATPVPEALTLALAASSEPAASAEETLASSGAALAARPGAEPTVLAVATKDTRGPAGAAGEHASGQTMLAGQVATLSRLASQAPARLAQAGASLALATRGSAVQPSLLAQLAQPETIPRAARAVRQLRGPRLAIAIALVCALLASGLGATLLLTHRNAPAAPVASAAVGQVFFVSSGQLNADVTQGLNDEVQINLQGIPAPQTGKSYYAWLLPDLKQSEAPDILLGKLNVQNRAIHYLYPGDSQHTDLLTIASRFLITEEPSATTPEIPTPDLKAWRYYAALPQTPAAGQTYSLLDHLRHLLAVDPDLEAAHLHGGLDIWAFRDTQQVFQWALSARDDWNAQRYYSLRTEAISMLDYLDGSANVAADTQPGTPILANNRIAQVGLLEFDPAHQNPPGYLYHIELHLNGVLQSPGSTQYQRTQATQITTTLGHVKTALEQVRHDATQLAAMDNAQLAQPSTLSLLNDMVIAATNAYQGQANPSTNQTQNGMSQLYVQIQKLAMFSVTPYRR